MERVSGAFGEQRPTTSPTNDVEDANCVSVRHEPSELRRARAHRPSISLCGHYVSRAADHDGRLQEMLHRVNFGSK